MWCLYSLADHQLLLHGYLLNQCMALGMDSHLAKSRDQGFIF
jgi:hypothetical protein